jgi:mRNA interferase MazF
MTATLQEQLNLISKEIFMNNININSNENSSKHMNIIGEIKNDKPVHSDINHKDVTINKMNNNNREMRKPQRRELWYVNLGNPVGSLQKGVRPCLVDSNDVNNKFSNIVNVFPLTSSMTKARIPVHIEVQGYGLKEKSIILIEQGVPIDIRYQLISYIGTVDNEVMKKVDKARNIQHGDLQPKTSLERLPLESKNYILNKLKFIEKAKGSIEFYKSINGDIYSINLAEDEKFREENALQSYCDYNQLDFNEIYNNYFDLIERKEKLIAI